jgi:hypothetical protein
MLTRTTPTEQAFQRNRAGLRALLEDPREVVLGDAVEGPGPLSAWNDIFRVSQGAEVWQALGGWVTSARPQLGPGTDERFVMASRLGKEEVRGLQDAVCVIITSQLLLSSHLAWRWRQGGREGCGEPHHNSCSR